MVLLLRIWQPSDYRVFSFTRLGAKTRQIGVVFAFFSRRSEQKTSVNTDVFGVSEATFTVFCGQQEHHATTRAI